MPTEQTVPSELTRFTPAFFELLATIRDGRSIVANRSRNIHALIRRKLITSHLHDGGLNTVYRLTDKAQNLLTHYEKVAIEFRSLCYLTKDPTMLVYQFIDLLCTEGAVLKAEMKQRVMKYVSERSSRSHVDKYFDVTLSTVLMPILLKHQLIIVTKDKYVIGDVNKLFRLKINYTKFALLITNKYPRQTKSELCVAPRVTALDVEMIQRGFHRVAFDARNFIGDARAISHMRDSGKLVRVTGTVHQAGTFLKEMGEYYDKLPNQYKWVLGASQMDVGYVICIADFCNRKKIELSNDPYTMNMDRSSLASEGERYGLSFRKIPLSPDFQLEQKASSAFWNKIGEVYLANLGTLPVVSTHCRNRVEMHRLVVKAPIAFLALADALRPMMDIYIRHKN